MFTGTKPSRLKLLSVLTISFALLFATACSSNGSGATPSGSDTGAANSGNEDEVVELEFWSWVPLPEEWDKEIYPKFQEKYPNIKINYTRNVKSEYEQKLKVAVQSGQAPDLMGLQLGSFVQQYVTMLEPLAPYAEKSLGSDWKSQFKEAPMERAADYDYKAMPTGIVTTPYLAYDHDMLQKAGIENPPATYAELKEAIKKLEAANLDGVIPRLGIAGGEWLSGLRDFFLNISNQVAPNKIYQATAGEISFTDPDLVKAAEELKKWYDDGIFQEGNLGTKYNPQLRDMFLTKRQLPMMMIGSWTLGDFADKQKLEVGDRTFGLAPFPIIDGGRSVVLTDGDLSLAINKDSKHKEAAWKFVEFMLTDEWQTLLSQKFVFIPVKKEVNFDYSRFTNPVELESAKMVPDHVAKNGGYARFLDYPEIDNALFENLQKVAAGDITPQQAMENVQKVSEGIKR
jgi:raffinose/stachyose/melibiose transport system substrate-binding protein